jgi:hypothetical protein
MTGPRTALVIGGSIACLVAAVGDLVVPFVLGLRSPGYSHLRQPVSDLGAVGSPVSGWMNGWWILFGVLVLWFAAAFAWTFHAGGAAARIVTVQIACVGLFAGIGAGLFPLDASGPGDSLSTRLHGLCALLGFAPILFAPAVSLWLFPPGRAPVLFGVCVVTQVIGLVTAALNLGLADTIQPGRWTACGGLWQRAFLANTYVYLGAVAVRMLAQHAAGGGDPQGQFAPMQ